MNLVPSTIAPVFPIVVMNRRPWRKVMWQHPPRAACTHQIQNAVNHLAQISTAGSPTSLSRWHQWLNQFPLSIRQIAGVVFIVHTSVIGQNNTFHTPSKAFEILASTYFAPAIDKGILMFGGRHRLGDMERFLEMVVIETGCRMFRSDPLGVGVLIGYVWRKLNEFLNLRILLRGKLYERSAVAIREELLIIPIQNEFAR